jgi:YVTN family beta-propeller protein
MVIETIPVGEYPDGIAFNPVDNNMYIIIKNSGTVSVIESSTNTVIETIDLDFFPRGIAFNPTNGYMYVLSAADNVIVIGDPVSES